MLMTNQIEHIYKNHKACKEENEHLIIYLI